jgi:hypothetical protein
VVHHRSEPVRERDLNCSTARLLWKDDLGRTLTVRSTVGRSPYIGKGIVEYEKRTPEK